MLLTATGNDRKILLEKIEYLKERWGLSSSVEGVEVSIVLPDFSPIKKLARSFGWKKVDYEDR